MNSGIKARLVWSYLLMILLTVLLFGFVLFLALRFYYIDSIKHSLNHQEMMFISFYERDFLEGDLEEKADYLLERFTFTVDAQVQLINLNGEVIADTHQGSSKNVLVFDDVSIALKGKTGEYLGSLNGENVLSIAEPIQSNGQLLGAIRMTTSLKQTNQALKQHAIALSGVGLSVVFVAFLISYFLAGTITRPIGHIMMAAEQMASGKFFTRIKKQKNDELGQLADTLNYMAEEVERHERLKNEFIASVSHELRTPLTSVKGWAITLQSMSEDDFFKEGLEIITDESDRLSQMLGELLDLSSLSAGKAAYVFENVNVKHLLNQVIQQLNPRAKRQGIQLNERYESEATVTGDANRLKQVFINVLDNALKFTSSNGTISVALALTQQSACISISDTGIGIPADELDYVKEKFHKGKSKEAGTGLGLAICHEIIDAHGGSFELTSQLGKGVTVNIDLPLAQA